jgi:hypothetical protein
VKFINRKSIRIAFIILLISILQQLTGFWLLVGQTYLQEFTIWKEYVRYANFPYIITEDYTIELKGDTLINNMTYFKTLKKGTVVYKNWYDPVPTHHPILEYSNPIREENKKFYIYLNSMQQDILLHDFDLSVGDKSVVENGCDNYTVTSIDTIYIGNIPRKQFHFDGNHEFMTLIEGVGSSRGLFYYSCNDYWEATLCLEAFIQDSLIWQRDSGSTCIPAITDTTDVIDTTEVVVLKFNIYPNPFTAELNIQIPSAAIPPIYITITNTIGKIFYQAQIDAEKDIETINLESLASGFFIVWLSSKDETHSLKIFKQ